MSEAQAEQAIQQLYESENLRGDLTDDEAAVLLGWGEAQIMRLAGRELDDEAFDTQFVQFRRLMAQIGRFSVKRPEMPPDAQRSALADMLILAQALQFKADSARIGSFAGQHESLSIIETLRALIELFQPTSPQADS